MVDDVSAKVDEIATKCEFVNTLSGKALDALWLEGDTAYVDLKAIADIQADLMATLVGELQVLTGG